MQATCFIHDNQEYNPITITNITKLGFDFKIEDYSQNYEFNSTIAWSATGMGHETTNSNLAWNFIVSGEGTHNVDNLSQYKEILLCCCVDDDRILATTIIPYQILDSTLGAEVSNGNHQAAYQVESRVAGVDFISNTSVTLYIKGSDVIPKLYGR